MRDFFLALFCFGFIAVAVAAGWKLGDDLFSKNKDPIFHCINGIEYVELRGVGLALAYDNYNEVKRCNKEEKK